METAEARIFFSFSLIFFCVNNFKGALSLSQHPIVMVMGFDGFRPDYVYYGLTPNLEKLRAQGVQTNYLRNVFPTKTYVNFFAIATGMYAETHGVLGNSAFSADGKCLNYSYELFHNNEEILPIWTLNEISGNGRHSGVMMWSGSQYPYKKVLPTFQQVYNKSVPWQERINTTMSWLLHEQTPANLIFMYFEQPDSASHSFGIHTVQLLDQIKRVDNILEYYFRLLAINGLENKVNVIVLSDHGMTNVDMDRKILISSIINPEKYEKCAGSPALQILPAPGFEKEILQNLSSAQNKLKTFTVYKPDEVPERWHYKHTNRNIALLAVAKLPFGFDDSNSKADHGYDNEEPLMRAFFAATGPAFRKKYRINSLRNIDIYPLIVYMMELNHSLLTVKPNGTLNSILSILEDDIIMSQFKDKKKEEILKYFVPLTSNFPNKSEE